MKKILNYIVWFIKKIRPKYYDKITWVIVIAGLGLMSPKLWIVILNFLLVQTINFHLIDENDILYGFILIIIALVYHIISRAIKGHRQSKIIINAFPKIDTGGGAINIQDGLINTGDGDVIQGDNNIIQQGPGSVINITNNIYIYDQETLNKFLKTIKFTSSKTNMNLITRDPFEIKFISFLKCLPWVNSVFELRIAEKENLIGIEYKTSSKTLKTIYLRSHYIDKGKKLSIPKISARLLWSSINILESIYWVESNIWTLNTLSSFKSDENNYIIDFGESLKNDISVIIGDITFIISDLQIKLVYDPINRNTLAVSHTDYGCLIKSFLLVNEKLIEIDALEMAIIDSFIDTKVIQEERTSSNNIVFEKNKDVYIMKLSNVIMKLLEKLGEDIDSNQSLVMRKVIIEFMKKAEIKISYSIPEVLNDVTDFLYNEAFQDSTIISFYNSYKISKK